MKHIFLNLKRFDIPREYGGVNGVAPMEEWGSYIVQKTQEKLKDVYKRQTHNIEEAVYLAERVLILSNKPAKIKEEVRIDLPRPRDITSSRFIEYRNYITDKIKWW